MVRLILAALLATAAALRTGVSSSGSPTSSRRALLGGLGAFWVAAPVSAAQVLTMDDDLSAPEPAGPDSKPIGITVISAGDAAAKPKAQTPAQRIKELSAKGGAMTDKEKKELKRLKQEEMCELLGRGC